MSVSRTQRRALLSVSDKSGLLDLARGLIELDFQLISTGGSAKVLREAGLAVTDVAELTGFPEIMDGRVKTLHPKIHGALLGRPGIDEAVMAEHDIAAIDLLVLNLYPFEQVAAAADCELATAIENIDIGGPAMLRAAAKNYARVAVLSDPAQYSPALAELRAAGGQLSTETRYSLAIAAFNRIARYDGAISDYLSARDAREDAAVFPAQINLHLSKREDLRYGENPHQRAAFYIETPAASGTLASYRQRHGKALSFNNLADSDAALECVRQFDMPACVIVKHANPCGVAQAVSLQTAYDLAFATDPSSAFGGIIAFNRELDAVLLEAILQKQFVEVIIAPAFSEGAVGMAAAKPNVRLLEVPDGDRQPSRDLRRLSGGLLVQDSDLHQLAVSELRQVSRRAPSPAELIDMMFAWRVAKFVKSNAIVYARDGRTIGIGAGQMSRVISARIAALKAADADLQVQGCALASDAFFPFRDGIDAAAEAGVTAIIHPGGSIRDKEVIAAADEHDIAMMYTGIRHFRH